MTRKGVVRCEIKSPVIIVRAAMQENAGTSIRMLWRLEENSAMESIHSPNARTHCSLCSTTPLQKTNLSSIRLDLDGERERETHRMGLALSLISRGDRKDGGQKTKDPYLYAKRKTKSSKKAESNSSSWSDLGSSEKPGIFSAQPRMMLMEPIRRS